MIEIALTVIAINIIIGSWLISRSIRDLTKLIAEIYADTDEKEDE